MSANTASRFRTVRWRTVFFVLALTNVPTAGWATPLLGSNLAGFAVLAATAVSNTGATTIDGNVGVSPSASITGSEAITLSGSYHTGSDPMGTAAQIEIATAITLLSSLDQGTTLLADLTGLVVFPGVYTVPAGVSNLTGTLTLDGNGNTNAAWVFLMTSTLITSPGAFVDVINTGAGAGIYWRVASSATLDTTTVFSGNILAWESITLNHAATIACGRALAHTGAVTMDNNTVGASNCMNTIGEGTNGFSGGLDVVGATVNFLPFAEIPEPGSLVLVSAGFGLLSVSRRRRAKSGA